MKITRRELAAAVVAAPLSPAQTSPDDLVKAARDRLKSNANALAAVNVPMDTEPAFQFKA
jgi:hypothetical protein